MHYILTQLPPGLRGLVTAGIVAAAVATTNSALNAMSSVLVQDFYRPWRERRGAVAEYHYVQAGRAGMGVIGVAMLVVAVLSFYWQHYAKLGLLEFALQVMVFAYAGLLGVYFTAVLTPRGTSGSVIASLIAGFVTVLLLQPAIAAASGCHRRCATWPSRSSSASAPRSPSSSPPPPRGAPAGAAITRPVG